jgi:LSD1 subclass zinc finger protein
MNQAGPEAHQALQAGNRERYRQLQYYMAEMRATYGRWSVPPRAWNDERYRKAWIAFTSETTVACAFDPGGRALEQEMTRLCLGLKWRGGDMLKMAMGAMGGGYSPDAMPKLEPDSFWPLVDVILAQAERAKQVTQAEGLSQLDPDQSPPAVAERMTRSMVAQGWLKSLDPDPGLELIKRLRLSHEYFRPEVVGDRRACGGCGGTLTLLPGATCVVCDGCGRRVEVGAAEMSCVGCGGRLSLPEGTDRVNCPWCQGEVRRT